MGGGLELNITGHKQTDIDVHLTTVAHVQDPRTGEWMPGRFSSLEDETLHGPLGDVNVAAIQRSMNPGAAEWQMMTKKMTGEWVSMMKRALE